MIEKVPIVQETETFMSKSKKKRLKRLKAKQDRTSEEGAGDDAANDKNKLLHESILNPIDHMKKDLVNFGYDIETVNDAIERMWNLQLDYSNFDSVLKFLATAPTFCAVPHNENSVEEKKKDTRHNEKQNRNERRISSSSSLDALPVKVTFTSDEEPPEVVKADSSIVDTSPLSLSTSTDKSEADSKHENAPQKDPEMSKFEKEAVLEKSPDPKMNRNEDNIKESVLTDYSREPTLPAAGNKAPSSGNFASTVVATGGGGTSTMWKPLSKPNDHKKNIRIKPFDLTAKLEIVANNQKLTDGMVALTEWVVKAASPMEVKQFCYSNALKIVIFRSIVEQSISSNSTGQLLDLLGSVLRAVGVQSTEVMSTAKALGLLLREASQAMDDDASSEECSIKESIAHAVSRHVTTAIGKVVSQYVDDLDSNDAVVQQLEKEIRQIESVMSKIKGNATSAPSIVDLMTARDKTKLMLEKYSSLVSISLERNNAGQTLRKTHHDEMDVTECNVMKDVLGEDYSNILQSKSVLEKLKAEEKEKNTNVSAMDELLKDVNDLTSEKKRICSRMEELKKELQQLAADEKHIDTKIKDSESKLKEFEGSLSVDARKVAEKKDMLVRNVKIEGTVSMVAKKVCEFAKTMGSVYKNQDNKPENSNDTNSKQGSLKELTLFLTATSRYFSSELKTIKFLKTRAEELQKDIPKVQREIMEFESLGMTTTVAEMRRKEKDMQNNVVDDNELVESLLGEADTTKINFVHQLVSYLSSCPLDEKEKNYIHVKLLKEIDACLSELGIHESQDWKKIMIQVDTIFKSAANQISTIPTEAKHRQNAWNV